jgi:TfoX/Sxy family transcriptional regulator of competence genes
MPYDEPLAHRIRAILHTSPGLVERKMFGGIGFLISGNMACGVYRESLIVRVGRTQYAEALARPYARPFDLTGRPMEGWVAVDPGGYASDEDLVSWVQKSVSFALTLPPK